MNILTCVERIIIESLSLKSKTLNELHHDTNLKHRILLNVVNALILRGIISLKNGIYQISIHMPEDQKTLLNDTSGAKSEALEIIESMLFDEQKLRLKKIYVSNKDKTILNALLINLNNFFQTLPPAPSDAKLSDYSVFVWGEDLYGKNIERMIGGVV